MSGRAGKRWRVESWVKSPGVPTDPCSCFADETQESGGNQECQRDCVACRTCCCGREGPEEVRPLCGDEGSFR